MAAGEEKQGGEHLFAACLVFCIYLLLTSTINTASHILTYIFSIFTTECVSHGRPLPAQCPVNLTFRFFGSVVLNPSNIDCMVVTAPVVRPGGITITDRIVQCTVHAMVIDKLLTGKLKPSCTSPF